MAILDKVISNVHICGIEVAFEGSAVPSTIEGWQPFYNSIFEGADFQATYATFPTIFFEEESQTTAAGTSYIQKATYRFPEFDSQRAERIALLHQIKFIKCKFDNGLDLVIGRNDYDQNTKPEIKTVSDGQMCGVSVQSVSMTPAGFTPRLDAFGLPVLVPITLMP